MSPEKKNSMADIMQRRKGTAQPDQGGGVEHTFRQVTEATPTKKTTFDLPLDVHRTLRWEALKRDIPMRDLVLRYIEQGMELDGIKTIPKD